MEYNGWSHKHTIREPMELVWEAWIRSDAWGFHEALRRQLNTIVDTTSNLHTDTTFFPWLETLPTYEDCDLFVTYNIGDGWAPRPILRTPQRRPYGTLGTQPFP